MDKKKKVATLKALDICGGVGGWAAAARGLPVHIVAAIDFAEDCCQTYRYNFPDVEVLCDDVLRFDFTRFQGVDIVLGGIPCEPISVTKHRCWKTTDLSQWHALLDKILAVCSSLSPRFSALENVVQMRWHLPPLTPYQIIDASYFSGQSRRRMFVGDFPKPSPNGDAGLRLRDYLEPGPHRVTRQTLACEPSKSLRYARNLKRVLDPDSKCPCVTTSGSRHPPGMVIPAGDRERLMTLREAARVQGFPEDFIFVATERRAWKMVAQAIPIPVGRAILTAMCLQHRGPAAERGCIQNCVKT